MSSQRAKFLISTIGPACELAAAAGPVTVPGQDVALDSDAGRALIEDVSRYAEGLLDDQAICSSWRMSANELTAIKNDPNMFEAVRRIKYRREQDGSAAQEAARRAFLKAPRVLEQILDDPLTPARGRIEASRELRAAAAFPSGSPPDAGEIFSITINLGDGQPITYSGPIHPTGPDDSNLLDITPHNKTKRGSDDHG